MASELKPETLRKKQLEAESLEQFIERMTLAWYERQQRLAAAAVKAGEANRRYVERKLSEDPEGFLQARREAERRYREAHPERVRERSRKQRERQARLAAPLRVAKALVKAEKQAQREADRQRSRKSLSGRQTGGPEAANSRAPKGRGQGYGAAGPMSPLTQPGPDLEGAGLLAALWAGGSVAPSVASE